LRQIGNAVPVVLGEKIGEALYERILPNTTRLKRPRISNALALESISG